MATPESNYPGIPVMPEAPAEAEQTSEDSTDRLHASQLHTRLKIAPQESVAGPEADNQLVNVNPEFGYTVKLTTDPHGEEAQKALQLEQSIWDENNYGSLDDYSSYLGQSRIFSAWEGDKCIGVTRVFEGHPQPPPFLHLPITNPEDRAFLEKGCADGDIEELGTAAVPKEERPKKVSLELWRLAYRDARARGVKAWGIIMEPNRVAVMNRRYDFTFRQLGEPVNYQGGECAVHYLDLEEVDQHMRASNPGLYDWFVQEPLNSSKPS